MSTRQDILIVGAGLSGLLAAIAFAIETPGAGAPVTLIDAGEISRAGADGRVTTLAPSSWRMLQRLGIALPAAGLMTGMRVGEGQDDSPWQFELPSRLETPLAYVVDNMALRAALLERMSALNVKMISHAAITDMEVDGQVELSLASQEKTLSAPLLIAADGRQSMIRRLAGISVSTHEFAQKSLVCTVQHDEEHDGVALQRFQSVGAIASLPLANPHQSQIVWSDRRAAMDAAFALDGQTLSALINERLWGALAVTKIVDKPQTFPLIARRAEAMTRDRIALIGDAARTIHPLAGQGFNLAIRDIAALVETVTEAKQTGQDIGMAGLIGYERWRRSDETLLGAVTGALSARPSRMGLLGRTIGHARRAAFATTDRLSALHPFIRQEAAGETGERPTLLQ
jgi:2-octaprenyl-6-methoxyphenol hydroxylase